MQAAKLIVDNSQPFDENGFDVRKALFIVAILMATSGAVVGFIIGALFGFAAGHHGG